LEHLYLFSHLLSRCGEPKDRHGEERDGEVTARQIGETMTGCSATVNLESFEAEFDVGTVTTFSEP
jgi:hypothetical protein